MNIHFFIHYHTHPGQQIYVSGSSKELGAWDTSKAFELHYSGDGIWKGRTAIKEAGEQVRYQYILKNDNGVDHKEWGKVRSIKTNGPSKDNILLYDTWHWPGKEEKALNSDAFQKVIMAPDVKLKGRTSRAAKQLEFRIRVPRIGNQFQLCVLGNQKAIGNWNYENAIRLAYDQDTGDWRASVDISKLKGKVEYKYGIYNASSNKLITLEEGYNRSFELPYPDVSSYTCIKSDAGFNYGLGEWKGAGVSVPVFSLRSLNSYGIGEFQDLIPFISWAKKVGLKMVQILPVNENIAYHNWLDSYPYKSISVVALHPVFLNPEKMGRLQDEKQMRDFEELRLKLNKEKSVDYPRVMALKSRYYKMLFDQEKKKIFTSKAYKDFFKENEDWLIPYAAYAFLRDKNKTPDYKKWGKFSKYDKKKIEQLSKAGSADRDDVMIHYFIQFHLDLQLQEVTNYARKNGVVLKGDIPIGISPNSVEAWTEPHLFNLDGQAGAPPDDFAVKGQNWGFPTYKWEEMSKENFDWWKFRLQKMGQYFDAYRIDHILGFFRIWEIPMDAVEGILGHFNPALPLSADEMGQSGVQFDYDRYVKPYIRYHILYEHFGLFMHEVIEKYLDDFGYDVFSLKAEFDTQQKINDHFLKGIEEEQLTVKQRKIRNGLFNLVSNVIFLELGEDQWHPRVNMHSTSSYMELDDHSKMKLDMIYNDFYYRRHNDFWHQKGMEKLPAIISASEMLVCGEDLGMVPDCVPPIMDALDILTLEIQRMPKNPDKEFAHPADAPYLSVCTTSTHDMSTIRGWWESNREAIQRFYNLELGNNGEAPFYGEPWICQQILTQHLFSSAMWTIFPVQDLLAIDGSLRWDETHEEQINVPSDVRHHWKFRMYQSIEELEGAKEFNELLKTLIRESGRNSDF